MSLGLAAEVRPGAAQGRGGRLRVSQQQPELPQPRGLPPQYEGLLRGWGGGGLPPCPGVAEL